MPGVNEGSLGGLKKGQVDKGWAISGWDVQLMVYS